MDTQVVTSQRWATAVSAAGPDAEVLRRSPEHATAPLPLISRTGFEQRHIVTSQIGSL